MDQTRLEWVLLGTIAAVCVGLSLLQYHWTGEASRADRARLRSGLNEQLHHLVRAFDDRIRENCTILLPEGRELNEVGWEEAHRAHYESWASSHDRALFSRITVAEAKGGAIRLYGIDGPGRMSPMSWPADWEALRVGMATRVSGVGPPPSAPPNSLLIEMPAFDYSRRRDGSGPEVEWMIFELNEDYVRDKVLPAMVAEYLNHGGQTLYDVSVNWAGPRGDVIFTTRADHSDVLRSADATIGIFSINNGGAPGRRGDTGPLFRWRLAVRHTAGSLDAAVAATRMRTLATALVLIALLGGAAWALVGFTGRSRRLAEMQFRFAAGVSHDLRTPLTAIRGAAFNLADGVVKEPAAVARYARLILRNAEELTSMIENVLAFSASHGARQGSDAEARHETFAIGDLLEHAAGVMAQEIEQAGCRIELNVAPELPSVAGDSAALELAFRNLISNAIRHAAQGGWIGVSAARNAEGIEVRVSDRGPGIPDPERERIFEPFYRGEQTRAGRVPGTGLGLSLVKSTVERHHGSITVHNSPGGGAQFTLRLPAIPELV